MAKAGYCYACKRNVRLTEDDCCENGHGADAISDIFETDDSAAPAAPGAPEHGGVPFGEPAAAPPLAPQSSAPAPMTATAVAVSPHEASPVAGPETIPLQADGVKTCPDCGSLSPMTAAVCPNCGAVIGELREQLSRLKRYDYGGFWARFAAYVLDSILLGFAMAAIPITFGGLLGMVAPDPAVLRLFELLVQGVLTWLYFAFMESSEWQATLGKKALGLAVADLKGERISFGRATGRYFAKIPSGFVFGVGYIMAAFTEKKQALHDMIAGTLVVRY